MCLRFPLFRPNQIHFKFQQIIYLALYLIYTTIILRLASLIKTWPLTCSNCLLICGARLAKLYIMRENIWIQTILSHTCLKIGIYLCLTCIILNTTRYFNRDLRPLIKGWRSFRWISKKCRIVRAARETLKFRNWSRQLIVTAVKWLKYCRYGEKNYSINQSWLLYTQFV